MQKKVVALCLMLILLLLVGCVNTTSIQEGLDGYDLLELQSIKEKARFAYDNYTPEEMDETLNELSKLFARLVNEDKSIKDFIGQQVGKKFDDDYDALFDVIADIPCKNGTMRSLLAKSAKSLGKDLSKMVKKIPYLNLAIPVNFDEWSEYDDPIYVIPLQNSEDDLKVTELIGYDGEGNFRVFDAVNPPDIPVLVLGINERIDYLEHKQEALKMNLSNPIVTLMGEADGTVNHSEKLEEVKLLESLDLWPRGNPELYVLVVVGDNYFSEKFYYEYADAINTWIPINELMFNYTNIPDNMYYWMQLRDYDGDSSVSYPVNESFTYDNVTYDIKATFPTSKSIGSTDDDFGDNLIYYWHSSTGAVYSMFDGATRRAYVQVGYTAF